MTVAKLGHLLVRNPREVWKNEEREFTPWLAENISHLSDLLGIPIVVEQTEHRVGSYELDILGRVEATDAVVIVENQLTQTDHGHLGQLLTYAAGLEAAIIIWVAVEIKDEHRAVIEWLNQHTNESVSFFLIRPEVVSIDQSLPAVRLTIESAPSTFARRLRSVVERDDRPSFEFRRKFWEALFAFLADHGHPWAKGKTPGKDSWIASSVGRSGIGVHVSMATGSRIRVEIYLSTDAAKKQFDLLFSRKGEIEALLPGVAVSWERLDDATAARIAVYRDYDKSRVADDSSERRALFDWIATQLTSLRSIARKYLVDSPAA
jgi:hypothetical protein